MGIKKKKLNICTHYDNENISSWTIFFSKNKKIQLFELE